MQQALAATKNIAIFKMRDSFNFFKEGATMRIFMVLLTSAVLLGMGGCASVRAVDASVQSYSTLAAALPESPTYRLELLPSQQAQAVQFAAIEQQAQQALAQRGLHRIEPPAPVHFIVQINAQSYATLAEFWPYAGPSARGWAWGGRIGSGPGHYRGGSGWLFDRPPTLQHRAVSLVMRDPHTQAVVYETSASFEQVWSNDALIFGTLFDAALSDFPHPPQGPRQIRREIPVQ